jgi:hypothetical protein
MRNASSKEMTIMPEPEPLDYATPHRPNKTWVRLWLVVFCVLVALLIVFVAFGLSSHGHK